jgi:RND family efflux transporter MFP subunit
MADRFTLVAALSAAVAALAVSACSSGDATQGGSPGASQGGPGGPPPVTVAVAPVERRTLARSVILTAPVEPVRSIGVNSQMTGTVLRVTVQEGDRVTPGTVMAQLDTRETEAQLARARATLANAEAAFRRANEMHERQIITDAEYEAAKAAHGTATSDVTLWETRYGFGRIVAPAAGMVTAKLVEAGSAVSPNQRMFELADESVMVVRIQVSELDVVHLVGGERVDVVLDAYPRTPVPGQVRRIFPSADAQSRLVPVEVALGTPPPGVQVRPGFLARVRLDLEALTGTLAIPAPAVGAGPEGAFAFVVAGDTLARRALTTGMTADGWVEVVRGLAEAERVVTSGLGNLRPGIRVRVSSTPSTDTAAGDR